MGNFDITKSRSSFFASLNKRKRLGLDSDSDSEEEDSKHSTKAKTSHEKTPESNGNSQATDGAIQQAPSNTTATNNIQPIIPQHTDVHLTSLSQQVQEQLRQMQGLQLQQESKKAVDIDDEEWLKEVTGGGESSRPPPAPTSTDLINLSSDEEEIEPLDESFMAGLDPELLKLVQNKSKVDQAKSNNKIDLKIQYVNNTVNEKYRAILEKLMKPIKIRVLDSEQFDKVLQVFCSKKKLKKDDALLVYNEDKVFLRTTPSGLGMKPNNDYVLYVYPRHVYEEKLKKEKDEREERFQKRREEESMMDQLFSNEGEASSSSAPAAEEQDQRMMIILRGKDGKDVHLRAKPTTKLQTLVEHYAKHSGLTATNNIKLQLDGETLNLDESVEQVGLEDEDLVDVLIT